MYKASDTMGKEISKKHQNNDPPKTVFIITNCGETSLINHAAVNAQLDSLKKNQHTVDEHDPLKTQHTCDQYDASKNQSTTEHCVKNNQHSVDEHNYFQKL